jgi:hypothetical protein
LNRVSMIRFPASRAGRNNPIKVIHRPIRPVGAVPAGVVTGEWDAPDGGPAELFEANPTVMVVAANKPRAALVTDPLVAFMRYWPMVMACPCSASVLCAGGGQPLVEPDGLVSVGTVRGEQRDG